MSSPSEEFKRKLLEPIEQLFKEALDGAVPPEQSRGDRNYQPPSFASPFDEILAPTSTKKISKPHIGKVNEAALLDALHSVNGLVGLGSAKRSIHRIADFARIEYERRRRKLPQSQISFHCVFSGSPGTGKTTFARLLGKILHALGLLSSGHTEEVDKSGLVGEFLGQTPHRVKAVFDRADGGVLFIDEAYSLNSDVDDLYAREAIEAIVKLMEDRRDRVVVVVAGYPKQMRDFIASNPGLRSRFSRTIHFADYDSAELLAIQKQLIRSCGFEATRGFNLRSELMWQRLFKERLTGDANGRMVRSAIELCMECQAARLVKIPNKQPHQLCELEADDLDGVEKLLRENHDA